VAGIYFHTAILSAMYLTSSKTGRVGFSILYKVEELEEDMRQFDSHLCILQEVQNEKEVASSF
jgi:hypothetical protein